MKLSTVSSPGVCSVIWLTKQPRKHEGTKACGAIYINNPVIYVHDVLQLVSIEGREAINTSCWHMFENVRSVIKIEINVPGKRSRFPSVEALDHSLWLEVSHESPSVKPSPLVAHEGWTYQFLSLIRVRPNFSWISCGFIAETRSKRLIFTNH